MALRIPATFTDHMSLAQFLAAPPTLNVLDTVVKDFVLPVNPTVCPPLGIDQFSIIVDLHGRTSLQTLPDQPCFKRVYWTFFQDHLSERLDVNPPVESVEDIDAGFDELTSDINEAITASASKRQPAKQPLPYISPTILANIRERKNG